MKARPINKKVEIRRTKTCGLSNSCNCGGAVYGLGFLGALIYYLSIATTFLMGVVGILKSIVWPAYLVYGLLKFLGM